MTAVIVTLVSGKGSPGASATALSMALCWPRPVLLIEADSAGASMVVGYAAGVDVGGRGLTGVRVAARRSSLADAIWANVVTLGEKRWLLAGVDTVREAESVDYAAVGSAITGLGVDVIVDAGRIPAPAAHQALWAGSDVVLVAMRSTLPAVRAAQTAAAVAREAIGPVDSAAASDSAPPVLSSVIIGAGRPYSERDIRAAMSDIAPVVGVLAWDPAAAGALVDALPAPRRIESTPLMRSATTLAKTILASFTEAVEHCEPGLPQGNSASPPSAHLPGAPPARQSRSSGGPAPARLHRAVEAVAASSTSLAATTRAGGAS